MRHSGRTTFTEAIIIRQTMALPIPSTLNNEQSKTANALISICKVDDLRFDISVYGDWLPFIPRRLGTSPVLDSATQAFISAYPSLSTGRPNVEALAAYGKAINALGVALNDPAQRHQPNTLMALHMVQTVQCWIDEPTDQYVDHPLLMAHLLPDMLAQEWKDPIDRLLLIISTLLIIITAMASSRVPFDVGQMRTFLKKWLPPRPYRSNQGAPLETMSLDRLVELPVWSRAPRQHAAQIRSFYREAMGDLAALQERVALVHSQCDNMATAPAAGSSSKSSFAMLKLYVQVQIGCSIQISTTAFLNAVIRAMDDPFDQDSELIAETHRLIEDCLQLAHAMAPFLPLYASGVGMTLMCVWAAAREPEDIARLEEMLRLYSWASVADRWQIGGKWARRYLARLREEAVVLATCNVEPTVMDASDSRDVFTEDETESLHGRCTIL